MGRLLRNIIRRKGLCSQDAWTGEPSNVRLGRATVLAYLTVLQAFVKQQLLLFAGQLPMPGSVVVETMFFRERWKCGLRS